MMGSGWPPAMRRHWPPPVDPLPLLPVRLQRQYGVIAASMEAQLRFAEDLQRRWLERADRCVFSCADAEDGRHAAPSPLLAALADTAPRPAPCPRARACAAYPLLAAAARASPVSSAWIDERAPPSSGESEKTRGVATLRAQSRCAFRGFAETRLRAEPLEHPVPGFNERERGEIVHDALQQIWSGARATPAPRRHAWRGPRTSQRRIAEHVRRAVARQCARRDPGGRWRGARAATASQAARALARARESSAGPSKWSSSRRRRDRRGMRGSSSRCASTASIGSTDGSRVLIDYKTGAAQPDWRGERPDNPQLPMYALLHRQSLIAVAYGK